jgi:hypothetical protein
MKQPDVYVTLEGQELRLDSLDPEERALVQELRGQARKINDWDKFENYWSRRLSGFYDARGIPRSQTVNSAAFQIAQDLGCRIAVAAGLMRVPDYRDEIEEIIQEQYRTRREFCRATGISEDMLSHVLAGRKHLAIDTLSEALEKIGYALKIVPNPLKNGNGKKLRKPSRERPTKALRSR